MWESTPPSILSMAARSALSPIRSDSLKARTMGTSKWKLYPFKPGGCETGSLGAPFHPAKERGRMAISKGDNVLTEARGTNTSIEPASPPIGSEHGGLAESLSVERSREGRNWSQLVPAGATSG